MAKSEHIKFNVNNKVRVKLTDKGRAALRKQWETMFAGYLDKYPYRAPTEDADGWSEWQLWGLMESLGAECTIGFDPPFETEIEFIVEKKS